MQITLVYHMILDHQIFIQKLSAVSIVSDNTPYFGSSQNNIFRFFRFKKSSHFSFLQQIERFSATRYYIGKAFRLQISFDSRPYHAVVTGDVNFGIFIH